MFRIGIEEIEAAKRVIEAKEFFKTNGVINETLNAEKEIKEKFGVSNAIIMTSGHAALASALIALGIGPGDQVIVPAYTYIATAMAVLEAGAIPVMAEIDETLTLSPEDFERKITNNTKAVIPVHIQGFPCDMEKICEISKRHGIFVVEDACQADGASFKGKRLGSIGDAGALSFNFYKIISSGEGGALLTNNNSVFEKALIYHDSSAVAFFGNQLDNVETQTFCGTEYRTNELNAAILREQLKRLDGIISDLRKNKKYITEKLSEYTKFIKYNDAEGDLGTTLALYFDTAEAAARVENAAKELFACRPINTNKHIYSNWTPILEKRGALHPLMDPFKMEANKEIVPNYTKDMCPQTLEILSRAVYISVNPDANEKELDALVEKIKEALK